MIEIAIPLIIILALSIISLIFLFVFWICALMSEPYSESGLICMAAAIFCLVIFCLTINTCSSMYYNFIDNVYLMVREFVLNQIPHITFKVVP